MMQHMKVMMGMLIRARQKAHRTNSPEDIDEAKAWESLLSGAMADDMLKRLGLWHATIDGVLILSLMAPSEAVARAQLNEWFGDVVGMELEPCGKKCRHAEGKSRHDVSVN